MFDSGITPSIHPNLKNKHWMVNHLSVSENVTIFDHLYKVYKIRNLKKKVHTYLPQYLLLFSFCKWMSLNEFFSDTWCNISWYSCHQEHISMSKLSMASVYHYILYTDKYNKMTKWLHEVLSGLKTEQIKEVCYVTIQITSEAVLQLAY